LLLFFFYVNIKLKNRQSFQDNAFNLMAVESSRFIDGKKERWGYLNELLEKIRIRGFSGLSYDELNSLGSLYREMSADLAFAKTHLQDNRLTDYLNNLVAKAHGYIYQTKPARLKAVWRFYNKQFPALFRTTFKFTLIAFLIFFFSAWVGFFTALGEERFAGLLLPTSIIESVEEKKMWTNDITSIAPLASTRILTNNISVTFSAFALGITLGIGTFYILALNGLIFGVVTYFTAAHNMSLDFWSFVLPHGIIELMCIFIAGTGLYSSAYIGRHHRSLHISFFPASFYKIIFCFMCGNPFLPVFILSPGPQKIVSSNYFFFLQFDFGFYLQIFI